MIKFKRYRIVNTDNYGGDYPDEKFVEPLPWFSHKEQAEAVAEAINGSHPNPDMAPRFFKVVDDDYQLKPGFEP